MKNISFIIAIILILHSCATVIEEYSDQDIQDRSDRELCSYIGSTLMTTVIRCLGQNLTDFEKNNCKNRRRNTSKMTAELVSRYPLLSDRGKREVFCENERRSTALYKFHNALDNITMSIGAVSLSYRLLLEERQRETNKNLSEIHKSLLNDIKTCPLNETSRYFNPLYNKTTVYYAINTETCR